MKINLSLFDRVVNASSTNKPIKKIDIYSTFIHEFLHIITNSKKNYSRNKNLPSPEIWLHEFISISSTYMLDKRLSEKLSISTSDYNTFFTQRQLMLASTVPYISQLTNSQRKKFTGPSYIFSYIFATYIYNNYGIEVFQKILQNPYLNKYSIFDAVRTSSKYPSIKNRPVDEIDLFSSFAVAFFMSENQQSGDSNNPYKISLYTSIQENRIEKECSGKSYLLATYTPKSFSGLSFKIPSITIAPLQQQTSTTGYSIILCNTSSSSSVLPNNISLDYYNPIATNIDLDELWLKGHGPIIEVPSVYRKTAYKAKYLEALINKDVAGSQFSFIYLGGKLNNGSTTALDKNIGFTINKDNTLSLTIKLPKGSAAKLIAVTYNQ